MEPEARYTLVGAVVLALIVAAAAGYVWLTRTGAAGDYRFYTIYFERQSLQGLQVGGDVTMRGVKVGRVEGYTISRDNINRVKVMVRVNKQAPVSENTVATVSRNIVTGLARINLVTPGIPGPELTRLEQGEDYPVIPEGSSEFDQLADAVTRLAVTSQETLDNLNDLFTDANRRAFAESLQGMRDLTAGLNQRMGKMDAALASVEASARTFQQSSADIAAAVDRMVSGIEPAARQADVTLRDFSHAIRSLERDASEVARRFEAAADTGTLELRATAQDVRASAELLSRAVDRLQEPRSVLLGPSAPDLGPGEALR